MFNNDDLTTYIEAANLFDQKEYIVTYKSVRERWEQKARDDASMAPVYEAIINRWRPLERYQEGLRAEDFTSINLLKSIIS